MGVLKEFGMQASVLLRLYLRGRGDLVSKYTYNPQ